MRGKAHLLKVRLSAVRITPAYAGKSYSKEEQKMQDRGSPPHMRGKVACRSSLMVVAGITPAYAGKRQNSLCIFMWKRDHPRICGEKPLHKVPFLAPLGITPAYAGKRLKRSRSTVPPAAIVLPFPSVCNRPAGSGGNPAERDAPPFLPAENAAPALPAYSLRPLKAFCGRAV